MEKYETSYLCSAQETEDLVKRLTAEGYRFTPGMHRSDIWYAALHTSSPIGSFNKWHDDKLLVVSAKANNPLVEFVEKYMAEMQAKAKKA